MSRKRRKHRRKHYREADVEADEWDESELSPEESALLSDEARVYRDARERADRKVRLARELLKFVVGGTLLIVFLRGVGVFITALWGFKIVRKYFSILVAPKLRDRWIEKEVEQRLSTTVNRERRAMGGEHARSMEQLSASIAHEIRNPITAAKSLVQQMGEDPTHDDNVNYAHVALEELERVERSVSHLLRYAREQDIQVTPMRMSEVIEASVEALADRLEQTGAEVHRDIDTEGIMHGDPEKLRRVLINLIGNALDALETRGAESPRIEILSGENLAGNEVWVRIRDNGPGIDAERIERLFQPFYTSKVNGTGLGLAISKKLVDAHGGSISVHSKLGQGTEFELTFPKAPLEVPEAPLGVPDPDNRIPGNEE